MKSSIVFHLFMTACSLIAVGASPSNYLDDSSRSPPDLAEEGRYKNTSRRRHLRRVLAKGDHRKVNGDDQTTRRRRMKKDDTTTCPAVVGSCGPREPDQVALKCDEKCYYAGPCEAIKAGYDIDKDCKDIGGKDKKKDDILHHTASPTLMPTTGPTAVPTRSPTPVPTMSPTNKPSSSPSEQPTSSPSDQPTRTPTYQPTTAPSPQPSTEHPTATPTTATTTFTPTETTTDMPTHTRCDPRCPCCSRGYWNPIHYPSMDACAKKTNGFQGVAICSGQNGSYDSFFSMHKDGERCFANIDGTTYQAYTMTTMEENACRGALDKFASDFSLGQCSTDGFSAACISKGM